jgi:hypothetical protein
MKVVICGAGIASDVAYPIDEVSVGADGVHSTVRRLVFGDESKFLRYLGVHTAAFVFDAPGRRAATESRFVLTDTVGRQMGFLPCATGASLLSRCTGRRIRRCRTASAMPCGVGRSDPHAALERGTGHAGRRRLLRRVAPRRAGRIPVDGRCLCIGQSPARRAVDRRGAPGPTSSDRGVPARLTASLGTPGRGGADSARTRRPARRRRSCPASRSCRPRHRRAVRAIGRTRRSPRPPRSFR